MSRRQIHANRQFHRQIFCGTQPHPPWWPQRYWEYVCKWFKAQIFCLQCLRSWQNSHDIPRKKKLHPLILMLHYPPLLPPVWSGCYHHSILLRECSDSKGCSCSLHPPRRSCGWNMPWLTYQWCLLRDESIRSHKPGFSQAADLLFLPEGVINLAWLRSPERLMGDHGFLPAIAMGSVVEAGRQHTHTHTHTHSETYMLCRASRVWEEKHWGRLSCRHDTVILSVTKRNNSADKP